VSHIHETMPRRTLDTAVVIAVVIIVITWFYAGLTATRRFRNVEFVSILEISPQTIVEVKTRLRIPTLSK